MHVAAPRTLFFGWKVVAAAFTISTFSFGVGYYAPPVFLNVLHEQRGWPLSIISGAITMHFLVSAILVTRLPGAHRRLGLARVTLAGSVALTLGMFGWSVASAPWQLFAAALLSGCGWAATSAAAVIAMVTPWFERRRPLALGHALNGTSVGGIIFVPLWVMLIARMGIAEAASVVGLMTLAVVVPLTWRYLRPTPESLGLAPDGDAARQGADGGVGAPSVRTRIAVLVCNRRFCTMSAAFALAMFAQVGVLAHLVTRLASQVGTLQAAFAVSLATACAVIGRVAFGFLLGDADRRLAAACNFAMQACGVALLALGATSALLVPGCILFGLGIGNILTLPSLIAQREFNAGDVLQIVALITAINQAVFAFAPTILGIFRDLSGDYTFAFLIAAGIQLAAASIIVLGRAPSRHAEPA